MIWSTTTANTQTVIISTGLNGNNDVRYWIICDIISPAAGGLDNGIQLNGDGGGNYFRIYNQGQNTTNVVAHNNNATQIYIGYTPDGSCVTHSDIYITAKSLGTIGRAYTGMAVMDLGAANPYILNEGGVWNNATANIQWLQFVGQFGAGTHFEIWSLR
jgi:hypothetical protein